MNLLLRTSLAILTVLTLSGIVSGSFSSLSAAELAGVRLGKHVSGPAVSAGDLAGKVVIFEYWGINCPPCLANIPHMNALASVASNQSLVVIANQCQGPGTTKEVWTSKGGTDKVTVIDDGELAKANVTGIPRVFVFDHTGKQVFDGRPDKLTVAMVKTWVEATTGPIATGSYPTCAAEFAQLRNTAQPWASALKSLRTKMAGSNATAKSEATALLGEATAFLTKQMAQVTADEADKPHESLARITKLAAMTKGDAELEKPYADKLAAYKADKTFIAEATASGAWAQIAEGLAKVDALPDAQKAAGKTQAISAIEGFLRTYANAKCASVAKAALAKYKGT